MSSSPHISRYIIYKSKIEANVTNLKQFEKFINGETKSTWKISIINACKFSKIHFARCSACIRKCQNDHITNLDHI